MQIFVPPEKSSKMASDYLSPHITRRAILRILVFVKELNRYCAVTFVCLPKIGRRTRPNFYILITIYMYVRHPFPIQIWAWKAHQKASRYLSNAWNLVKTSNYINRWTLWLLFNCMIIKGNNSGLCSFAFIKVQ